MIGQSSLINRIDRQIMANTFPRFAIIVGDKGSGKKTLANHICSKLGCYKVVTDDVKVDTIRSIISQSYKTTEPTMYIIADADSMSMGAKNALLKITEEPPYNACFILTLTNIDNTLDTIKSRGTVYKMLPYSADEITDYVNQKYKNQAVSRDLIDLCDTMGDVNQIMVYNFKEFYDYVKLVFDNIGVVSGSNAFKIGDKINLKDDLKKYDLKLFWKAFMKLCIDAVLRLDDRSQKLIYIRWVQITDRYLSELRLSSINKHMTFDMWLLDIRKVWLDADSTDRD